ncbi:hypothetical protein A3C98_01175 [Candidatus Roizmanbacteria bacterium RIFCSPHIGHO2_02_FULL_37_15]|uniref:Methyltransferase domain-containing protein n=1 Tax=Candidatus Roizmanbacteria bacterium RIFCSPLOWO2_01_FULL_37_16 TaxID=1802058 RepID=A0A1F7IJI7_9BACT|nr:MAG: hypothetical protein A2859_05530 [Candidatus Roizmanbacteria bacterium RIFCSPHIGHO2_01_FULL_37_16b]OGK22164.1 MAG: hypothetical protein A3C98_01175 [Candidatus Roizmanbacteria bacterium RIFCSPHIGHO2_02_FULL_37_15]OGK34068.1 MAG: hypothetical protein A3F57_01560 [Candidatus Roizmanbacteria bacterium RIFCSPHIGHO2_12_FULL_36_11]OGK43520.1 MAG: hypothetical protein A3B40_04505 [Candidatus Roizmanbacteria bacterium RIFCSPLOWO2_01_FULL_37_16]
MKNNNLVKQHKYYNNEFFAKWAKLYDLEKYILFPLRKKAARFLDLKPPKKIVDVATGTGAQAFEFAKIGHDVIGIDLSPEMLNQAKKKIKSNLKLKFLPADGIKLPFKNNSFDASTISLGLHDMPYEIGLLVLKEMKRVSKKGGLILIIDYNEPKKHFVARLTQPLILLYETSMYKPFINRGIETLLKEIDLKIYRETNFLGIFQILLLKN